MKKSKPVLAILVVTAVTAFALPAAAQDSAVYIGGSVGQSKTKDFCVGATNCGDTKIAWRGFGGYQINRNFAAEGGYHYLGKFTADSRGTWSGAVEAVGIGFLPFTREFSLYGKLGVYHATTKAAPITKVNNGWTYGAGAEVEATRNVALRADFQRYAGVGGGDLGVKADINVFSVAVILKFR